MGEASDPAPHSDRPAAAWPAAAAGSSAAAPPPGRRSGPAAARDVSQRATLSEVPQAGGRPGRRPAWP